MNAQRPNSDAKETVISEEMLLKVSKEIAVKFIEVGRITPSSFPTAFAEIYRSIDKTVRKG